MNFNLATSESEIPVIDTTGIEVQARFRGKLLWKHFAYPRVSINDEIRELKWGRNFLRLPPGKYTISVFFRYFFFARCGESAVVVKVAENQTRKIEYSTPLLVFMEGSIREVT